MPKINIADSLAGIAEHWSPQLVARINDTDVKLVKLHGEFVFHHHEHEDEMFLVIAGKLLMRFREHEEWIGAGEFIVVPRGVEHCPVAHDEVHVMLIEPGSTKRLGNLESISPDGDAGGSDAARAR